MVRPVSLDEELFRMPPKTENLAMTRSELFLVHRCRLARARMRIRLSPVYIGATLNVRLSPHVCTGLRFCLRFVRLLLGRTHLLALRGRSSLGFFRLRICLLWLRLA